MPDRGIDRTASAGMLFVLLGFFLVAAGTLAACSTGGILLGLGLLLTGRHD